MLISVDRRRTNERIEHELAFGRYRPRLHGRHHRRRDLVPRLEEGSWAVFFSHPADFTPVCTTELGRTAALQSEFASATPRRWRCRSTPIEDHHGWAPDIGEVSGTALNFPIVADPDRSVAELYDMIHPGAGDTSTVRSVFIIDPDEHPASDAHLPEVGRPQLRRDRAGDRRAPGHRSRSDRNAG